MLTCILPEYNTIVHIPTVWGPPAISLLATPPKGTTTNDYVLCSIKSALYRNCTTWYKVAQSGGLLTVHCDADERNTKPYYQSRPDAPIGEWNSDWKDIGGECSLFSEPNLAVECMLTFPDRDQITRAE